ncbi:transmembrane protein 145-like, partial [Ruditapes philippinarum]|uniref:transmembrane protein 145-like n=1 Tax=Ruditapes philippinarum TaxID=129788 RepID=UPI00295A5A50
MARTLFYVLFTFLCLVITSSHGKYVEGEINTLQDWEFITRFCFLSAKGTLRFTFEYPITYGPQHILLYYDTPDQWDAVYKSDKTCRQKLAVLDVNNNQIINLTTSYGLSGCTINNAGMYNCVGGRIFRSSRERWWFIAVSHCDRDPSDPIGINLKYKIHMTNGAEDDYL